MIYNYILLVMHRLTCLGLHSTLLSIASKWDESNYYDMLNPGIIYPYLSRKNNHEDLLFVGGKDVLDEGPARPDQHDSEEQEATLTRNEILFRRSYISL